MHARVALKQEGEVREILNLGIELEVEVERAKGSEDVHLCEDVDVGHLELEHRPQREEEDRNVLGRLDDVARVGQVDGSELAGAQRRGTRQARIGQLKLKTTSG